jgi:hypothetical protein
MRRPVTILLIAVAGAALLMAGSTKPGWTTGCPLTPPWNMVPPQASISADGTTVTTTQGTWKQNGGGAACQEPIEYSYAWQRHGFFIADASDLSS